jgi:hypothetical protein
VTNPPPARDKVSEDYFTTKPAKVPSFAIPETPVPPPAPRDSEPELTVDPATLLAKAAEALAKASEAAAKPSESVAKPSELLAKPSESLAKPSELLAKPSVSTAILGGAAPGADDAVWDALEDAVAMDRLVVGDVVARREEGFLIGLGAGVHGVLPEAQLGGLDADAIVGGKLAFRVISLNAGKKRVVLSHKDVEAAAERALVGRATPIGFSDPTGGQR